MSQADLEISLFQHTAESYGLALRFRHAAAGLDKPGSGSWTLDAAELLKRQHDPVAYGEQLAAQLFGSPDVRSFLDQALAVTAAQRTSLHLRLFISAGAAALHSLRWETLRLPDSDAPLAAGEWVRFSRYLDGKDWRSVRTATRDALQALIAVASPDLAGTTLAEVRTDDELAAARAGLGDIPAADLAGRGQVTLNNLLARLRDGCDILYLVAHGMLVDGEPQILLESEDGGRAWASGRELAARLGELAQQPGLVVLVSCQSAGKGDGEPSTRDGGALAGLGPRLAAAGVPAVIAMQGNVTMDTAAAFMPTFLRELRRDGQVDRAMAVARGAVLNRPDWWMPVLFTRLLDGRIWTPSSPDARQEIEKERFEPETVYIPAGSFLMGSPPDKVDLAAYRIGRFPVMNWQYQAFLHETKRGARPEMRWDGGQPFKGEEEHPVTGVTWCDALAYCRWLSGKSKTGRTYTLPSEAQWERAARGVDGRTYPWGNKWQDGRCHVSKEGVASVKLYPAQIEHSGQGVYDLVGNAPEWTRTIWGLEPLEPHYPQPWQDDGRDDLGANSQMRRIVRGGAASDPPEKLRCAARSSTLPLQPGPFGKRHGFRVMVALGASDQSISFCEAEARQP